MNGPTDTRPPPPWLRERTPEERARERDHLRQMEKFERDAIALGINVRPIIKETKK